MAAKNNKKRVSSSKKYTRSRRKHKPQNNGLVLRLLLLVALVLIVFEGRLIHTMFTQGRSSSSAPVSTARKEEHTAATEISNADANDNSEENSAENADANLEIIHAAGGGNGEGDVLVGVGGSAPEGETDSSSAVQTPETHSTSESPSSDASSYADVIVPAQSEPMDDSFFRNSVFIGDSRMEGFRNASGITQGTFLTSVGMSLDTLSSAKVSTAAGTITVFQGLSGTQYDKIYLMLGTNDLGYYPWEMFLPETEGILSQMHQLQPSATIYVCSVIFVEESKVTTDYVNNENVKKVNGYLLQACQKLDYCYYLNLNEIFNNGYDSLIDGASRDGVHLEVPYLTQMLQYLRTHYVSGDTGSAAASPQETQTEASTDSEESGDKLV